MDPLQEYQNVPESTLDQGWDLFAKALGCDDFSYAFNFSIGGSGWTSGVTDRDTAVQAVER
jgi:hypothetical protein